MHWIATLFASASLASAQLIAYESFSGMPTGGGISGTQELMEDLGNVYTLILG